MAASSPASSSKASDSTGTAAPATVNGNGSSQKPSAFELPKPNLRGLNKPKCIQCGNVARSRCPFQCCKSCCFKAQNPCHIHVLKQNNTLPEKPPPSISPLAEQPSNDSPSIGASSRLGSLRQLSHNVLNSLRTRKPVTKKDLVNINKWRFMKLKEHMQGDIEVENEAFERYTHNIRLLEETFSVSGVPSVQPAVEASSLEDSMETLVSEAKVRLKSDSAKEDAFKERIGNILDLKLKELQERQNAYNEDVPPGQDIGDHEKSLKLVAEHCMKRTTAMSELLDKLIRARSEDDLKPCLDMRAQLFEQEAGASVDKSNESNNEELLSCSQESNMALTPFYSLPKLWTRMDVDEDSVSKIDAEFSSLNQIAQL